MGQVSTLTGHLRVAFFFFYGPGQIVVALRNLGSNPYSSTFLSLFCLCYGPENSSLSPFLTFLSKYNNFWLWLKWTFKQYPETHNSQGVWNLPHKFHLNLEYLFNVESKIPVHNSFCIVSISNNVKTFYGAPFVKGTRKLCFQVWLYSSLT